MQDQFKSGMKIETSGIYEVFHEGHRLMHRVTVLSGGRFPKCQRCGPNVRFTLIAAARDPVPSARYTEFLVPFEDARSSSAGS